MTHFDHLWTNARLLSSPGDAERWAIAVRGDTITAVLSADAPELSGFRGTVHDCRGKWITPGFVDCHTHLVWGGSRAAEWEMRLSGVPYAEIARRGGGILSTVRATRALTEDELFAAAVPRLRA